MGGWGESGVACARLFDAIKLLMCKEIKKDSCCFLCELCAQNKECS